MNDVVSAKLARIEELVAVIRTAEGELESLLGVGTVATPPTRAKRGPNVAKDDSKPGAMIRKVKGERLCGICRKPGHQARTCEEPIAPREPQSVSTSTLTDEADLADAIRYEWGEGGRPSSVVAKELGISLGRFNDIVQRYEITQSKDDGFGSSE